MRFNFQSLSYLAFAGLILFSSCKKDEETPVVKPKTAFTTTKTDTLWNIAGAKKGAYDLVGMVNKGSSDADGDKDMVNTTDPSMVGVAGKSFVKEFTAKNSTKFYSVGSSFNFDGAYKEMVDSVYKANTASATSTASGILPNNTYIANLRGAAGNYAIVKIVKIQDDGDFGPGKNNDYIVFTYKK
jgi:hypothetical protein